MPTTEQIYDAIRLCFDPEIPVNIVDLGLVYGVDIQGDTVEVTMSLTTPGCGMGKTIALDVKEKVLAVPGVADCSVTVVWEPPWSPEMMSEDAKKMLGVS